MDDLAQARAVCILVDRLASHGIVLAKRAALRQGRAMHSDTGEARPFPMREAEFVTMMAALMALQALAIDVMLPALGMIAQDLGVTNPNDRQLVIGVFLIGGGLFALFPGPLADRFGRRPVALVSLCAYFALSLACAFVTEFTALLVLRAMLGMASAGLVTIPIAVVRDRFAGDRMARAQSLIAMIFMLVPILAPLLGQAVLLFAPWRAIFAVEAALGLAVGLWVWRRLPETLHPEYRQAIEPRVIAGNMWQALSRRESLGYVLGGVFIQATILAYINSSQQLIAEAFNAGAWFPTIFGLLACAIAVANFINSRIVERFGARRLSHGALLAGLVVVSTHALIAWSGMLTLPVFMALMALTMFCNSFQGSNFQSIAMQPFARIAGAAASAMSAVRLIVGASLGSMIGRAYDGTAVPMTTAFVILTIATLVFVLYSERGTLFRRLNPPKAS
jgi:MFS transporter, DHA1 family, multidrug resistance protein